MLKYGVLVLSLALVMSGCGKDKAPAPQPTRKAEPELLPMPQEKKPATAADVAVAFYRAFQPAIKSASVMAGMAIEAGREQSKMLGQKVSETLETIRQKLDEMKRKQEDKKEKLSIDDLKRIAMTVGMTFQPVAAEVHRAATDVAASDEVKALAKQLDTAIADFTKALKEAHERMKKEQENDLMPPAKD